MFDAVYQGNPLVNALAVGVLRHEDLKLANASGAGNLVVLFGARTGGDGIGGASILASDTFADGGPTKRPAVQVGDPFAEKVLIECCLELYKGELVEAIQDLGAAGISCATSELAANGGSGMRVDLEKVLLRDPTLTPEEILMSESQERMMAIVAPDKLDAFLKVVRKWDVETSVLGEVTGDGRLRDLWHGEQIVDVDPSTVAVDGPGTSGRSPTRPGSMRCGRFGPALAREVDPDTLRAQFTQLVASPTSPTRRGSRTSTTTSSWATPRCRSPTTPAWSASTSTPASASRSRRTATAGSASSTPTRAPSSPSPRRTATSPSRRRADGGHRLPELRQP